MFVLAGRGLDARVRRLGFEEVALGWLEVEDGVPLGFSSLKFVVWRRALEVGVDAWEKADCGHLRCFNARTSVIDIRKPLVMEVEAHISLQLAGLRSVTPHRWRLRLLARVL